MTREKETTRPSAMQIANRVRKVLDDGVDKVEEIHKKVASFPLELMEQVEFFHETARDLNKMTDRSIGAAYDIVRGINHDVIRITKRALRSERNHDKAQPRKKSTKQAAPRDKAHEAA